MKRSRTIARPSGSVRITSEALNNLGVALAAKGRLDEAIENYRQAIQINPNFSGALNNLAWTLATSSKAEFAMGRKRCNWPNARVS